MSEDNILVIKNGEEWNRWVRSAKAYDFYHLYSYHRLAEKQGEGQPILIVYKEGDKFVAIPFLIRRLWEVEGLEEAGKGLSDITSVYGYAGPLSNIETIEPEFLERFLKHLRHSFADNKVVAAFSRLHPILDNHIFFPEEQIVKLGKTVSIDLSLPQEAQRKFFRKNHIRNIKKAYKTGVEVRVDETWEHLDDFIAIYESTMDKVSATDYYYFDREYYISLRKAMGESLKLFIALFEGKVISAGLFTHTGSIVQYHLGGTLPDYLRMSAFTCIIDTVREYMTARGAGALHLGGGLGSAEDNLFHFKAGFSDRRHQFSIWKYIANNTHYEKLNQAKEEWNKKNNKTTNENYFPLYRG